MADVIKFGPWRGFVSTRSRMALEPDELGPDSAEWSIDPIDGRLCRRGGSTINGDTLSGGNEVSGLTEVAFGGRCHQLSEFRSSSLTDGYPSYMAIVCDEANKEGSVYFRSTNGPSNRTLGDEFGSTHYTTSASTEVQMKVPPFWSADAAVLWSRLINSTQRKVTCAGTRRAMTLGDRTYLPNADSTPLVWDHVFNDATGSGSNKLRLKPWGLHPPLYCPTVTLPSTTTGGYNWESGDTFYLSVAFEYETGEVGPPFQISTTIDSGSAANGGLITVDTAGGTNKYEYIQLNYVPIGDVMPRRVVARRIYMSAVVKKSAASASIASISPFKLYPVARIPDNTTKTYRVYAKPDTSLVDVDLRFDHQFPPRAQHAVAVDGRTVLGGKMAPNPLAIIIAPTGGNTSRQYNCADDDTTSLYGSIFLHVRITSSNLYLKKTTGGVTSTVTIDFATYDTLQKIVDRINVSTTAGIGGTDVDEWAAALVPGVSGDIASTNLAVTSANDFGDDSLVADATSGNARCHGPNYPFYAAFSQSYLSTNWPADNYSLFMSSGGPTKPDGAFSLFYTSPALRKGPSTHAAGRLQAIVPITGIGGVVAVVFYENARYVLRNIKSGGTREDGDYALLPIDEKNGCVSWMTCNGGPGFAFCVGQDGLWVTDGSSHAILSNDMYDPTPVPGSSTGEWATAIAADSALTAQGSPPFMTAFALGGRIRVRYRSSTGVSYCDRGVDYPYRAGYEYGLASLLRLNEDGPKRLYGWTCPVKKHKYGQMARYVDSGGINYIGWSDTNLGTTNGRVDKIDQASAATDNGTAFASDGYTATVLAADYEDVGLLEADLTWKKSGTGLTVTPYVNTERSDAVTALTLASSGSTLVGRATMPFDQAARANNNSMEFKISDDGSGTGEVSFRGMAVKVDRRPSVKRKG